MEFAPGVLEHLGFYVYELVDPVSQHVFYVGKGVGDRVNVHCKLADLSKTKKSEKISQIRAETGRDPVHRIVAHNLSEETAFLLEAVLIEHLGLTDLKNKARGHGCNALMLDVEEINALYAPREVSSAEIEVPTIFVSLNGGRELKPYPDIKNDPKALSERTLGDWVVSNFNANLFKQIVGCFNGLARVVYDVDGWDEFPYPKRARKRFRSLGRNDASHLIGARVLTPEGRCLTHFSSGREKNYALPFKTAARVSKPA